MIDKKIPQTRRRGRNTSGIMIMIGVLMIFTPSFTDMRIADGGGALIMIGLLLSITGIVILPLMTKRDKMYEKLINATDRIAYWEYDKETWNQANEKRLNESKGIATLMIFVIDGLIFLITLIFAIADPSAAGGMFLIMGCIAVFLTLTAIISPRLSYLVTKKQTPMVMIGKKGAVYGSELHYWDGVMGQFKMAQYCEQDKTLRISYVFIGGTGTRQEYELVIQVPDGHEKEAEWSVLKLEKEYNKKKNKA